MTQVNPPPHQRIPPSLQKDREAKQYFERLNFNLFQLWKRTGGSTDEIENSQQNITNTSSRSSRNAARINSLELKQFEIINTTESLETEGFQIIICKNTEEIDITLDPQALDTDEVHIKRRGAPVNVIGTIDGLSGKIINVNNYSMHLVYDGEDWSEI